MIPPIMPLFDHQEGRRRKERGMEDAASGYGADEWLIKARSVAEMLAAQNGEVTIDDVLKKCPRPESVSPAATGSVFKGKKFRCVGFTQTEQAQGHARTIRRWALA